MGSETQQRLPLEEEFRGNTERFTGRVSDYERYRMKYPAEAILAQLRDWCGLEPDQLVADIGAGTGMLSKVFLENGNRVIAVEPNAEMRQACEARLKGWPKLSVLNATAEQTTLDRASVDLVSAGRSFHWFDTIRALAEFRRILKPRGWVALVAAGRDQKEHAQSAAYEQLLHEHGTDYAYIRAGYRIHERMAELFPGGAVLQTKIEEEQTVNFEELVGQTMSLSVAPLPGHAKHEGMMEALRAFFERFAQGGAITIPTSCWITCASFIAKAQIR
jgi:ubiquinone/menaquinone biosynthesis C-methylase UbiE